MAWSPAAPASVAVALVAVIEVVVVSENVVEVEFVCTGGPLNWLLSCSLHKVSLMFVNIKPNMAMEAAVRKLHGFSVCQSCTWVTHFRATISII